jgi:predicted alpha/beta-fold hydrolase
MKSGAFLKAASRSIIDAGQGVNLLGFHNKQQHLRTSRGLVALLHGWEGSSDSSYIVACSKYFYSRGYDTFRLNLRDHGDSHQLNEGLFHGALIEETSAAIQAIALLAHGQPFFLMGFSLGGNFALRVALRQSASRIPNLRHVIAVSPALDPLKSTLAIDNMTSVYRNYFLGKWKRSLRKKQTLFPHRYEFSDLLKLKTCMALTEAIMSYYPEFPDYRSYFNHYTLVEDVFSQLEIPVSIITSADDPVVPVDDFNRLKTNVHLKLYIHDYGGHCGFFESFPSPCWYEEKAYKIFESHLAAET